MILLHSAFGLFPRFPPLLILLFNNLHCSYFPTIQEYFCAFVRLHCPPNTTSISLVLPFKSNCLSILNHYECSLQQPTACLTILPLVHNFRQRAIHGQPVVQSLNKSTSHLRDTSPDIKTIHHIKNGIPKWSCLRQPLCATIPIKHNSSDSNKPIIDWYGYSSSEPSHKQLTVNLSRIVEMEAPYAMHAPMPGNPYIYYEHDGHRQEQGHFQPYPAAYPPQMHPHFAYGPVPMPMPPHAYPPQIPAHMHYPGPVMSTPVASPQPHQRKAPMVLQSTDSPALMPIDTRCGEMYCLPSTPPLSSSGSITGSPPSSCGALPTPNDACFGQAVFEGVKEGCEVGVHSQILANIDWSRAGSPPMTPGMYCLLDRVSKSGSFVGFIWQ